MDMLIERIDGWLKSRNIRFYRESAVTPDAYIVQLYCVDHYHLVSIYSTGQNYWLMVVYDVNDVEDGSPKIDYFVPGTLGLFCGAIWETLDPILYRLVYRKVRENAWTNCVELIEGQCVDEILNLIRETTNITAAF